MRRLDIAAASCAVVLIGLQFLAGGISPFADGDGWGPIRELELEVRALEERRAVAQAEQTLRESYASAMEPVFLPGSADRPAADAPPEAWLAALGPGAASRAEWEWGDVCRFRARGRFVDVFNLLGEIDRTSGSLAVRSLEIVPEGEWVIVTVLFSRTGGA